MIAKKVKYTDYNGVEREETHLFNLSEAELIDMNYTTVGGLTTKIENVMNAKDVPALYSLFKDIVIKAYGIKSDDGRRFMKTDKIREEFAQTEAYSKIFTELATNDVAAAEFINGVIPKSLSDEMAKQGDDAVQMPAATE